ncbi:TPA: hypothetical protein N0F65_008278 [Lagenidium giganteum]|uniref:Uncharacterized protein n=1 Tax=Lagenidium giganteum TaxID=4803 RepID=A0AAV2YP74_9STRA|nr:TPA: hypothetical protein N0F65_008278 [Lagenidium giganteum]
MDIADKYEMAGSRIEASRSHSRSLVDSSRSRGRNALKSVLAPIARSRVTSKLTATAGRSNVLLSPVRCLPLMEVFVARHHEFQHESCWTAAQRQCTSQSTGRKNTTFQERSTTRSESESSWETKTLLSPFWKSRRCPFPSLGWIHLPRVSQLFTRYRKRLTVSWAFRSLKMPIRKSTGFVEESKKQ